MKFGPNPFYPLYYPAPLAFQTARSGSVNRSVNFVLQSTGFGLVVPGLDTTLPLQIAINVSGTSNPQSSFNGAPHTVDSNGNTFFARSIPDAAGKDGPFPPPAGEGCGVSMDSPYPCSDAAVYKFSATGVLDFITYLAGRTNDIPGFVGLASDGTLVVAGTTDSSDFPVSAAAFQPVYAGPPAAFSTGGPTSVGGDFFAAKLDPSTGQLQSSTYLGGPNSDSMGTAALGPDGSLYFLPVWSGRPSGGMPVTSTALLSACDDTSCQNGYAARLSPSLDKLIFGTYLPGVAQSTAQLYSDGSVYYSGWALPGFPTTRGAYQPQNAGNDDGIVARLDPSGTKLLFATYIGGPDTDWIYRMAVAPDGSVWALVTSFVQCCIAVHYQLVHLDANGSRLLAQLPMDVADMVVDQSGNLIALAYPPVTVSPDAVLANPCGNNAYVKLSPSGQQLFATYLGVDSGGFDGADAQGTPFLDSSSGRYQVVLNQNMVGPFAGCVVDAASFGNPLTFSPGAIVTIFGSGLGPKQGVGSRSGKRPGAAVAWRHSSARERRACTHLVLLQRAVESDSPLFPGSRICPHRTSGDQRNPSQPSVGILRPTGGDYSLSNRERSGRREPGWRLELTPKSGTTRIDRRLVWHRRRADTAREHRRTGHAAGAPSACESTASANRRPRARPIGPIRRSRPRSRVWSCPNQRHPAQSASRRTGLSEGNTTPTRHNARRDFVRRRDHISDRSVELLPFPSSVKALVPPSPGLHPSRSHA